MHFAILKLLLLEVNISLLAETSLIKMDEALNFFINEKDINIWKDVLTKYDDAIRALADYKKKLDLVSLDKFYRDEYINIVMSRDPPVLHLNELSNVMKWKLSRGKMRPLQKLVDSNCDEEVRAITKSAIQSLKDGDWEQGILTLTSLKGIGPATASAILAPLFPDIVPFMADEVLFITCDGKREYTMKAYHTMRSSLLNKSIELSGSSSLEDIGRCIWIIYTLSTLNIPYINPSSAVVVDSSSHNYDTLAGTTTGNEPKSNKRKRN